LATDVSYLKVEQSRIHPGEPADEPGSAKTADEPWSSFGQVAAKNDHDQWRSASAAPPHSEAIGDQSRKAANDHE
jgi:hypothetical protein